MNLIKRSFLLMMSVGQGKDITSYAEDLVPASAEVAEAEAESLAHQWAQLHSLGLVRATLQAAEWFADVAVLSQEITDMVQPDQLEELYARGMDDTEIFAEAHTEVMGTLGSFGVALLHKLMSEGLIVPARGALR